MTKHLIFPAKEFRAEVIAEYMLAAGYKAAICFSCGNASEALKRRVPDVVEVSPSGPLRPGRWWLPEEIHRCWPQHFDATPGHLSAPLMVRLAAKYRKHLGPLAEKEYLVPTGSGETILCLRIAYPAVQFTAEYNDGYKAVRFEPEAPLNEWVNSLFPVIKKYFCAVK